MALIIYAVAWRLAGQTRGEGQIRLNQRLFSCKTSNGVGLMFRR
jgi:hypothetical protein